MIILIFDGIYCSRPCKGVILHVHIHKWDKEREKYFGWGARILDPRFFSYDFCIFCSSEVGETPLHKAAETSSVAVVKLLLDEGAEINPKTDAKVQRKHCALYIKYTLYCPAANPIGQSMLLWSHGSCTLPPGERS